MTKKSDAPAIRFKGFSDAWEQRKLSEITDKVTEKNAGLQYVETFTNSAEFGIISQRDFFDHDIAKLGSLDGYYIVKNEDFVYNPRISTSAPVGPINRNKLGRTGVMSPLYTVFRPHDIDTTYLEYFFKCGYWHSFMNFNGDSGARSDRFSIRDNVFFQMPIPIPDIDEQRKIGELLTCLDNLITLHQRKFEKLTNVKKSMLEKMFPQNGSSYPEIRFKGFTDPWEQRKLGELCNITTGKLDANAMVSDGQYDFYTSGIDVFKIDVAAFEGPAITIAGNGASVGYMHLADGKFNAYQRTYVLTDFLADRQFLNVAIGNELPNKIQEEVRGSGIPYIVLNMLTDLAIPFPSHEEQYAIGVYFQQLDNLITLHQRKCANLCSPSQVVFSLLFATSTFSWEQRKLGEMGQTYTGLSGKTKDDFGHGQARFVTYMNVFSNPISNPEMTEPIEIDPKQNEVEVGDVFFTTSSETPEEVGMSSILLEKRGKTYLNSFCFGFRPSEKIDSYYLAYMLRSESTRAKIILLAQGISRYNISKNKVMEIAVSLPSLDEQKLIGQYISQLDNLITLHQRKPFLMKWRTSDANRNQTNRLVL